MRQIHTTLLVNPGCEGDLEFGLRFTGTYYPATPAILHGPMASPAEAEIFELGSVQIEHRPDEWTSLPACLRTPELEALLVRIGIADERGLLERDRAAAMAVRHAAE